MHSFTRLVAAIVVIAFSAGSIEAQSAAPGKGIHLGAAVNGTMIDWEGDESDSGPGLSVYGAYNFTRNIGVVLGVTGASLKPDGGDSYRLMHTDLGLRYTLRGASSFAPYAEAGYTMLNAKGDDDDGELEYKGSGFTGTLGGNYFFSPKLALDLNFRYTKGEFDTVEIDGESVSTSDGLKVTTMRINVGFAYYL